MRLNSPLRVSQGAFLNGFFGICYLQSSLLRKIFRMHPGKSLNVDLCTISLRAAVSIPVGSSHNQAKRQHNAPYAEKNRRQQVGRTENIDIRPLIDGNIPI